MGLLAIRQRLELMGGRMQVESAPGRGTRITIEVPIAFTGPESSERETAVIAAVDERRHGPRSRALRVLLADDHAVLRHGLASSLSSEPGIELVGEAADGVAALEQIAAVIPDVVLMDVSMPRMDGIEATRQIRSRFPAVRVVGLSMHDELDVVRQMTDAGAEAFVTKGAPMEQLVRAVRGDSGERPVHDETMER
jgi:CheY-like chemotaxis protein